MENVSLTSGEATLGGEPVLEPLHRLLLLSCGPRPEDIGRGIHERFPQMVPDLRDDLFGGAALPQQCEGLA